jgi:uncharacterized protein (TIGR02145 family)
MNKDNVMKSSPFHMDDGDVLHLLFLDEGGTTLVTVDLVSEESADTVPNQPVAIAASDITSTSFTANWNFMENSTGYRLTVATDSAFTSILAGYNKHDCLNTNSHSVAGLTDGINYYYKIYAYNSIGESISSETITMTTSLVPVTDADGNVYTYVQIGTQQWIVEPLKTTKFNDGSVIPPLPDAGDWAADTNGAYCWYNNDSATYKATYGALYNWYAVNSVAPALLAPTGWKVPTDADWTTLITLLGGLTVAGGKLKELGTAHWNAPNVGATDEVSFMLLPTGYRSDAGLFVTNGTTSDTWSSSEKDATTAWAREVFYSDIIMNRIFGYKKAGYAVRCMRDI